MAGRNLEQSSAHHCHCCSWQIWGFLSESRAAAGCLGGCDRFMSERMRRVDRRCLRTTSHQLGGIFTPVCRSLSYSTDSHNCSRRQRSKVRGSDINYQYTRLEKGETFHSHPLGKQSFCRQIPSAVTMTRSSEDFLRSLKGAQTTQEPAPISIPLSHEKDCESFSFKEYVVWCMWPEFSPPIRQNLNFQG